MTSFPTIKNQYKRNQLFSSLGLREYFVDFFREETIGHHLTANSRSDWTLGKEHRQNVC